MPFVVLVTVNGLGACSNGHDKTPAFCAAYGELIVDLDRVYDAEASGATAALALGDIDQALADSSGLRATSAGRFTAELDGLDTALTSIRTALSSVATTAGPEVWAPLLRSALVDMDRSAVALDAAAAVPCVPGS